MVTHKTFPNHRVFETQIGNRTFTVETGKVAELANAECICRYGDTVVLTTVTASPDPKPGIDYFPLTIEFEERLYSVGRIPGSFNRREGKPSERGILNSRLIDRPMRPLFDEELRNDVVVTCTVLANDYDNPVEIVASLGASISIASSDVPWNGPVATTNVAYVNGEYVVNPSAEERAAASCFVTIASTFEKVVMIETEANESPESIVLECIRIAHETNMEIVKFINGIVAEIGKPKFTFEKAAVNHDLLDELCAYGMDQIEYALDTDDKNIREERLTAARRDFAEKFAEKYEDFDLHIEVCLYKMQKKVVKKWLLAGKRVDGRGMDEIRPLAAEVGVLPRVHGSGLFTRGQTQGLSICTLNTLSAAQKLDTIYPEETKRYIHHYNFPAFSTGEAKAARSTSRREIGHGALAEKALLPVIPSVEEFPYAIRVVSEVLSSNGSTSQGSICGSTLALMDAGVPIKRPVAGISCGLITEGDRRVEVERDGRAVTLNLPLDDLIAMRQKKGYEGFLALRFPFIVDSTVSAAASAVLKKGDEILAVDDLRGAEFPDYQRYIRSRAGDSVRIEALREGDMVLTMTLPVSEEGLIGVAPRQDLYTPRTQEYTLRESIPAGIRKTGEVISSYWEQLKLIVQPKTKMYEELGGFIAIGSIFPAAWDWQDFWMKTAFLSIILAVMNILPIPGLDGGHALFTFWEMISGRKVSDKVLEAAQYVGMIVLLMLLLYANGNDIYRFFIK